MCHHQASRSRQVAILACDSVRTLDLTGLLEVLDVAATMGGAYSVALHSCGESSTIRCSSGLSFETTPASTKLPQQPDTIVIPGGNGLVENPVPQRLLEQIRLLSPGARRIAALGTGTFALAETGLLDGKRATTHWRQLDALVARHPSVIIERDSILTRDSNIWTSAGATAGIDLALALVADDHGTDIAAEIAKDMVVFSRRLEGHPQLSVAARTPRPNHPELERLLADINVDPAGDYELRSVAATLGLSARHLARLFKARVGVTLRQYVHEVRLENAVSLALAGESFHAAARRSGLRYNAGVRDHLAAHRQLPDVTAGGLLVDTGGPEAVSVRSR